MHDVGDDEVDFLRLGRLVGQGRIVGGDGLEPVAVEEEGEKPGYAFFVVYD